MLICIYYIHTTNSLVNWTLATNCLGRNNGLGRDRNIRQLVLSLKRVSSVASAKAAFIRK